MSDPTFWDNPDKAREISQEATQLKNAVESYKQLVSDIEDANVMLEMAIDEDDLSMESEIKEYVKQIEETLEKQEVLLLLSGEYDANNAILTFHAGAGGTAVSYTHLDVYKRQPLLVQIFLIYFALPMITGQRIDPYIAAVTACSINSGAYVSEIFRCV